MRTIGLNTHIDTLCQEEILDFNFVINILTLAGQSGINLMTR